MPLFALDLLTKQCNIGVRQRGMTTMAQAQPLDRGTIRDRSHKPAMIVLEVAEPSKHEIYRRLAEMPGVRVLIVEEHAPMR